MSEAVREMTFDEEYEILQAEKNELFAEEDERAEPPFANCVVRRALRCIRKLKEEREQYRAIGTVSEFRELKEKATAIKADGFSDYLLNMGYTKGMKDGYAKAIDDFSKAVSKRAYHKDYNAWLKDTMISIFEGAIDEIATELKGE